MRFEVVSEQRTPNGALEAETLWLLTDAEVQQFRRTGLAPHIVLGENVLAHVHHVLSPSRSATHGQRIISRPDKSLLHTSGVFLPPDSPDLWTYRSSGPNLARWRLTQGGFVDAFLFPNTSNGQDEYLDPQWQRERFSPNPSNELDAIANWKAELLDGQLSRDEPIRVEQRTTLNLQVGASGDDGYWSDTGGTGTQFDTTVARHTNGHHNTTAIDICHCWYRFTGVSGLFGATINTASYQLWGDASDLGSPLTKAYAEEAAAPAAPTSASNADGKTVTTAGVDIDSPALSITAFNPFSVVSVIQELADTYDSSVIQILHKDDGSDTGGNNIIRPASYDRSTSEAAKLDIDYTAGGTTTRRYSLTLTGVG